MYFQVGDTAGGGYRWYKGTSEKMTIFQSGNVAIGTTTDAGYKLDVSGTGRFTGQLLINNTASPTVNVQHSGSSSNTTRLAIYGPQFTPVGQILLSVGSGDTAFPASLRNCAGVTAPSGYWINTNNQGQPTTGDIAFFIFQSKSTSFNSVTEYASAQVAIDSTTKGFLPPRMTTTQINAIASPAEGLVVYNTTLSHLCC